MQGDGLPGLVFLTIKLQEDTSLSTEDNAATYWYVRSFYFVLYSEYIIERVPQ